MLLNSLLSLVAILALAALNRWLGRAGRMTREPVSAPTHITLDLIDFEEHEGESANDGAAYVAVGKTPADLAVAIAMGDGWVTRRLGPGSLRRVSCTGAHLALATRDFTLPTLNLVFPNPERAARWAERFAAAASAADPATATAPRVAAATTTLERQP
jgi:hypothetical protein